MRWVVLVVATFVLGCEKEPEMPFRPPAVPITSMDARQQATYFAQAGIQASDRVRTFTPTAWTGFSVDPTGDISYRDFGAFVVMWADDALVGTSDAANFTLAGVPSELIPDRLDTTVPSFGMLDNAINAGGQATLFGGTSGFAGQIHFFVLRTDVVANFAVPSGTGWTASGNKGLSAGWLIVYPK